MILIIILFVYACANACMQYARVCAYVRVGAQVCALLHDIGELLSPSNHGEVAAGVYRSLFLFRSFSRST